jgi:seryl-tRNA synthetase
VVHRIYLGIILCGVIGGAGWFAYNYYVDTQTRIKAELVKQQELNSQLNDNLQQTREANKAIAKLLADTDIIKNSLADPKASEDAINEQIDFMFGAIGCATGTDCVRENP